MTYREDFTLPAELMEQVQNQGLDVLPELIRIVTPHLRWVQVSTLRCKRSAHLNAGPYQRSEERRDYANGFKPKTMRTRVGEITLAVPQVREGGFYP